MRAFDSYCGLCILALYFLYLSVVKGALSVFDCTMNKDGVFILDADASILCNQVQCTTHARTSHSHAAHALCPR